MASKLEGNKINKRPMLISSAAISDVGKRRKNNEDNFYLSGIIREDIRNNHIERECNMVFGEKVEHFTCAVFDGIGGIDRGEDASLIAAKVLNNYDNKEMPEEMLTFYYAANSRVCEAMDEDEFERIGTTGTVLHVQESGYSVGNVGDSRAYKFNPKKNKLFRLTKDQTQAQQLIDAGAFTEEQLIGNRQNHVLTQYIGMFEDEFIIEPDISVAKENIEETIFVLCSDGLTDMVKDNEIKDILKKKKAKVPIEICKALVEEALEQGGKDNITVVVVKIG